MKSVKQGSTRMEQSQELRLCKTGESHSLGKYFKKEEEKNSQAKCKVQLSAVPRDCCLGLKQEYYILIIQFINDFTFLCYESCFVAT